jgi:hypothetical protein
MTEMNSPIIPAYLIATIRPKNLDEYLQRYGMPVLPQLNEASAEVLVASASPEQLSRLPSVSNAPDECAHRKRFVSNGGRYRYDGIQVAVCRRLWQRKYKLKICPYCHGEFRPIYSRIQHHLG